MPANCTADVNAVIEHVDSILAGGDNSTIQAMKANFGLQDIVHVDDFAAASTLLIYLCSPGRQLMRSGNGAQ